MRWVRWALSLAWVCTVMACHQVQPEVPVLGDVTGEGDRARVAAKHVAVGNEYLAQGRMTEAVAEWRLALELDPSRSDVAVKLSQVDTSGNEPEWRDLGKPAPEMSRWGKQQRQELLMRQARRFYQNSQLKEAELLYQEVLLLDPGNAMVTQALAEMAEERYQPNEQRAFDQMTQSLYEEGMRMVRRKSWDRAERKLSDAANMNPEQPQVRTYLLRAREARIRTQVAAQQQVWLDRAQQAEAAQDWGAAFAVWRDLTVVKPPLPEASAGMARCQPHAERWALALVAKARGDVEDGHLDEARAGYEKVLAIFPEHADAVQGLKRSMASGTLLKKAKTDRAEVQSCCLRGEEAYRRGDLPGAVAAWEMAAKADPQDARIQTQWQRMRREWDVAQDKNRRLAQTQYEAGLAAYQRGKLDEARTAWKATLELDPAHARARSNLRRMEMDMN